MALCELNARASDGSVLPALECTTRPTTSSLVILIHGYNNTRKAADQAYREFLGRAPILAGWRDVCTLYWPGDKKWGAVSFLSYPIEIAPARATARALEAFLNDIDARGCWPLDVILVCHSLGNRVGLETIRTYLDASRTRDIRFSVCLMAAAVPVKFVEFGGSLSGAATRVRKPRVLYSGADLVLFGGFPIGETLAGEGFFPAAIGAHGDPTLLWGAGNCQPMRKADGRGYAHGDYWYQPESARAVTDFVNDMRAPAVGPRGIAENVLPFHETLSSDVPDRVTPSRPSFL